MDKQYWLDLAEIMDAHRAVPKLMMATGWAVCGYIVHWYTGLAPVERTAEVSVFAGLVFAAMAKAQDYYFQGGRKWDK